MYRHSYLIRLHSVETTNVIGVRGRSDFSPFILDFILGTGPKDIHEQPWLQLADLEFNLTLYVLTVITGWKYTRTIIEKYTEADKGW